MSKLNEFAEEKITLALPVNSAYVSAARLTASSISNRMGFSIEDIEDIKAAISEACIFIINSHAFQNTFNVEFLLKEKELLILLSARVKDTVPDFNSEKMGIMMIQAMMDTLNVVSDEGEVVISMCKYLKHSHKPTAHGFNHNS